MRRLPRAARFEGAVWPSLFPDTHMKELPILFSGPMVRALLDGSKTQTRRIVNPQPIYGDVAGTFASWMFKKRRAPGHWLYPNARSIVLSECPYGERGDRLWVRETHEVNRVGYEESWSGGRAHHAGVKYQADDGRAEFHIDEALYQKLDATESRGWTPSIHMPRWASRITLEITGVRAERLQDISATDAEAEGVEFLRHVPDADETLTPQQLFMCLWDSINEARGCGWNANPWVWVVEFKRVEA